MWIIVGAAKERGVFNEPYRVGVRGSLGGASGIGAQHLTGFRISGTVYEESLGSGGVFNAPASSRFLPRLLLRNR